MILDPSTILYRYGLGLAALNRHEEAIDNFHQALDLNPDYAEAYVALAKVLYQQGRLEEAADHFRRALGLNPTDAEALFNLGNTLQRQKKFEQARDCYKTAAVLDPDHAGLHYAALEAMFKGEMQAQWTDLQWIMLIQLYRRRTFLQPQWQGTPLKGQTLLVYTQYGFGDTIQLMRYLSPTKALAQGTVVLECQPELVRLLRHCEGVDEVVPREVGVLPPLRDFDTQIGLYSLPLLFAGRSIPIPQDVPYLRAHTKLVNKWKARMASFSGLKVGLRWAGSPTYPWDATRSCHLRDFAPLAHVSNITYFSLQKGAREEEAASPPSGMRLIDLSSELHDFIDTAAVLTNLDLVISTDTSVPHLAGALGRPVWLLLEAKPGGRWHSEGEGCIWYPTMRIFRQSHPGDWSTVLARVAEALQKWTDANKVERATGHKQ